MTAGNSRGAHCSTMRNQLTLSAFSLLVALGCHKGPRPDHVSVATVSPQPGDVTTLDGIMRAFYEVVNIAPDGPRQWSRDRTLYSPWIRFVATGNSSTTGRTEVQVLDHQQLVEETEPLIKQGFREREIHRSTRSYGHITHIDSTYETEFGLGAKAKKSRGVNSVELYFDGQRWWIASVMWMSEDKDHPIPSELLSSAER